MDSREQMQFSVLIAATSLLPVAAITPMTKDHGHRTSGNRGFSFPSSSLTTQLSMAVQTPHFPSLLAMAVRQAFAVYACVLLTVSIGALQVDLFGYLGLRYSTNMTLRVNPSLPPQIPYLKYPTFHFHGWPVMSHIHPLHKHNF